MRRTRLAPALAGAALALATVLLPATVADAAVTSTILFNSPAAGTTFKTGGVNVTGSAGISPPPLGTNSITNLSITVSGPKPAAGSSCSNASCEASTGVSSTTFSFTPAVAYNGPYSVAASLSGTCTFIGLQCTAPPGASQSTSFAMAVPPASPGGVKTTINGDNSVAVSWNPNPEPDVIGYQVLRQGPGNPQWTVAETFTKSTSWTDSTPEASGGFFDYEVIVVRPGASGGAQNDFLSTTSATVDANVPVVVVTSTTDAATGTTGAATTTTTASPASTTGTPNISAFLSAAASAGALPPKTSTPTTHVTSPQLVLPTSPTTAGPPNTFAPTLPYGRPAETATTKATGGGQVALPASSKSSSGSQTSVPLYIAGGLLLCLLGVALRTANRRSHPGPLEAVAHDTDPTGPGVAVPRRAGGAVGTARTGGATATAVRTRTAAAGVSPPGHPGSGNVRIVSPLNGPSVAESYRAKMAAKEAARRRAADADVLGPRVPGQDRAAADGADGATVVANRGAPRPAATRPGSSAVAPPAAAGRAMMPAGPPPAAGGRGGVVGSRRGETAVAGLPPAAGGRGGVVGSRRGETAVGRPPPVEGGRGGVVGSRRGETAVGRLPPVEGGRSGAGGGRPGVALDELAGTRGGDVARSLGEIVDPPSAGARRRDAAAAGPVTARRGGSAPARGGAGAPAQRGVAEARRSLGVATDRDDARLASEPAAEPGASPGPAAGPQPSTGLASGGRPVARRAAEIEDPPIRFARPAPGQPLFPDLAASVSKIVLQPEPAPVGAPRETKKPDYEDAVDYFRLIRHQSDGAETDDEARPPGPQRPGT